METKKQKKIFNIIMVAVIVVIIAAGIAWAGSVKGWFSGSSDSFAEAASVTGVVNVERNGVSFELEEGSALQAGDKISTNSKAQVRIASGENIFTMAENSAASIDEGEGGKFAMTLEAGEVFAVLDDGENFKQISAQDTVITSDGTVFSVNVQTGSMGVNVFEGDVAVSMNDGAETAGAGKAISIAGSAVASTDISITSLNEFNITQAMEVSADHDLCFTKDELQEELDRRAEEAMNLEEEAEEQEGSSGQESGSQDGSQNSQSGSSGHSSSSNSGGSSGQNQTQQPQSPGGGQTSSGSKYDYTCTIEIRCDTILNNMADLDPSKAGYVPSSGYLLKAVKIGFNDGETVLDVLKRACSQYGIHLEYSYTPMYGSSYIEGIGNLYEFDCGPQSGWMYKVNGWFPNYGCSSYKVSNGDSIAWCYTCKGLGEDLGAAGVQQ